MKQFCPGCLIGGLLALAVIGAAQSSPALSSGVDLSALDKSVNPCQDFYKFACGSWIANNPVPADQSVWTRFSQLHEHNEQVLHEILDDSAQHRERSQIDEEIGTFYGACMNEGVIEKAGYTPIKAGIAEIQALKDKSQLSVEVAKLHEQNVNVLFRFGSEADPDKSTLTIANADQGGLVLPDKSYYLEAKDEETRAKYVQHISRMFQLIGYRPEEADAKAKSIMTLERSLASASLDRTARRDPNLTHHKMTLGEFEALTPGFDYQRYLAERRTPAFDSLNVAVPDFFKSLNATLAATGLEDLKAYLTWHYISANADFLSKRFVDEDFDFFSRYLSGAQQLQPRWKRCVQFTDGGLGEALGQKYVARAFAGQSKEKTLQLVGMIEKQMAVDIDSLTWMSDTTKQQALAKLKGVTNKIGYPERWRDYSSVPISNTDLVANQRHATEYEVHRNLDKIGKPVDRSEFGMTPPTVNAYYHPLQNNINFPAGILQPPFFSSAADMAVNFGGIGAVIGHELTHGFDDQGRQYDADGNLRDWWTKEDAAEFKKRADCIAEEYSNFSPLTDVKLNGRLTLGENGADNAGIRLAYMALLGGLDNGTVNKEKLDSFTPQQRFFLGFAQIWCANQRPESARVRARTDPHSPGRFRVIGVVENSPDFAKAFGCSAGEPMVAAKGCRVW